VVIPEIFVAVLRNYSALPFPVEGPLGPGSLDHAVSTPKDALDFLV